MLKIFVSIMYRVIVIVFRGGWRIIKWIDIFVKEKYN